MGAKYSDNIDETKSKKQKTSSVVIAPKDSKASRDPVDAARKEVKSKFKELIKEKKKKQCNYEEVHALYKT